MCSPKYQQLCIGIDQSYQNTGISISVDGQLKLVSSFHMERLKTNSIRRQALREHLTKVLTKFTPRAVKTVCLIERIRLRSGIEQSFINIDYIKSIGALNSIIVDVCTEFGIEVYSVDTRCWKSRVIGTTKGKPNEFGVPEEKYPTVEKVIEWGFESSILELVETRKTKGVFVGNDQQKYQYNNDAADSAGISMFWWNEANQKKLQLEK